MIQDNIFGGNNSWEFLESVLKIMTLRANWQDIESKRFSSRCFPFCTRCYNCN